MHVAEGQTLGESPALRRQRDRRRGLGDVLATLARAVSARAEAGQVRGAFEESLKRALPVRSIVLRDRASRWPSEKTDDGVEALAFEVVGPTTGQRGMLEATFDRSRRLGDWDFQLMGHAAQLGALVLEVERARAAAGRGSAPVVQKPRRDGAAPLIGSTPAMTSLRDRIEKVAATDFTVLLEGETRRELARPVWPETARECADGKMAGAGESAEVSSCGFWHSSPDGSGLHGHDWGAGRGGVVRSAGT